MRPGNKQRSIVWEHFKKNSDKTTVTCEVENCKKDLKLYGNTTNLKGRYYNITLYYLVIHTFLILNSYYIFTYIIFFLTNYYFFKRALKNENI